MAASRWLYRPRAALVAVLPLVAVLLVAFATAGCGLTGGDDDDAPSTTVVLTPSPAATTVTAAASSPAGTTTPARAASPSPASTATRGASPAVPAAATGSTGAAVEQVRGLARDAKAKPYRAGYDATIDGGSGNNQVHFRGVMTLAYLPPSKELHGLEGRDSTAPPNSPIQGVVVIVDGSTTYFCSERTGTRACERGTRSDLTIGFVLPDAIEAATQGSGVTVTPMAGRRIAARDASCWQLKSPESDGFVCGDTAAGVILFADGKFRTWTIRVQASSVTTTVTDNDFRPPFPVR